MTYPEIYELLQLAKSSRAKSVTVELDPGEITLSVPEAIGTYDRLSPGEPFEIISINH